MRTQRKMKQQKKEPPQRNPDARLVSAYVDKKVAHAVKVEAAKLNLGMSDYIRHLIDESLKNDDLKPPPKEL